MPDALSRDLGWAGPAPSPAPLPGPTPPVGLGPESANIPAVEALNMLNGRYIRQYRNDQEEMDFFSSVLTASSELLRKGPTKWLISPDTATAMKESEDLEQVKSGVYQQLREAGYTDKKAQDEATQAMLTTAESMANFQSLKKQLAERNGLVIEMDHRQLGTEAVQHGDQWLGNGTPVWRYANSPATGDRLAAACALTVMINKASLRDWDKHTGAVRAARVLRQKLPGIGPQMSDERIARDFLDPAMGLRSILHMDDNPTQVAAGGMFGVPQVRRQARAPIRAALRAYAGYITPDLKLQSAGWTDGTTEIPPDEWHAAIKAVKPLIREFDHRMEQEHELEKWERMGIPIPDRVRANPDAAELLVTDLPFYKKALQQNARMMAMRSVAPDAADPEEAARAYTDLAAATQMADDVSAKGFLNKIFGQNITALLAPALEHRTPAERWRYVKWRGYNTTMGGANTRFAAWRDRALAAQRQHQLSTAHLIADLEYRPGEMERLEKESRNLYVQTAQQQKRMEEAHRKFWLDDVAFAPFHLVGSILQVAGIDGLKAMTKPISHGLISELLEGSLGAWDETFKQHVPRTMGAAVTKDITRTSNRLFGWTGIGSAEEYVERGMERIASGTAGPLDHIAMTGAMFVDSMTKLPGLFLDNPVEFALFGKVFHGYGRVRGKAIRALNQAKVHPSLVGMVEVATMPHQIRNYGKMFGWTGEFAFKTGISQAMWTAAIKFAPARVRKAAFRYMEGFLKWAKDNPQIPNTDKVDMVLDSLAALKTKANNGRAGIRDVWEFGNSLVENGLSTALIRHTMLPFVDRLIPSGSANDRRIISGQLVEDIRRQELAAYEGGDFQAMNASPIKLLHDFYQARNAGGWRKGFRDFLDTRIGQALPAVAARRIRSWGGMVDTLERRMPLLTEEGLAAVRAMHRHAEGYRQAWNLWEFGKNLLDHDRAMISDRLVGLDLALRQPIAPERKAEIRARREQLVQDGAAKKRQWQELDDLQGSVKLQLENDLRGARGITGSEIGVRARLAQETRSRIAEGLRNVHENEGYSGLRALNVPAHLRDTIARAQELRFRTDVRAERLGELWQTAAEQIARGQDKAAWETLSGKAWKPPKDRVTEQYAMDRVADVTGRHQEKQASKEAKLADQYWQTQQRLARLERARRWFLEGNEDKARLHLRPEWGKLPERKRGETKRDHYRRVDVQLGKYIQREIEAQKRVARQRAAMAQENRGMARRARLARNAIADGRYSAALRYIRAKAPKKAPTGPSSQEVADRLAWTRKQADLAYRRGLRLRQQATEQHLTRQENFGVAPLEQQLRQTIQATRSVGQRMRALADIGRAGGGATPFTYLELMNLENSGWARLNRGVGFAEQYIDSIHDQHKIRINAIESRILELEPRDRRLLNEVLRGERSLENPEVSDAIRDIAIWESEIRHVLLDRLVRLGKITPEQFNDLTARHYVEHVYAPDLLKQEYRQTGFFKDAPLATTQAQRIAAPARLAHLKTQRDARYAKVFYRKNGIVRTKLFPVKELGYQGALTAAKKFHQELPKRDQVKVVKPITDAELGGMGLVEDTGTVRVKVLRDMLADQAKMDFFSVVSNLGGLVRNDLTALTGPEKSAWTKPLQGREWGPLEGKHVHRNMLRMMNTWGQWHNVLKHTHDKMQEDIASAMPPGLLGGVVGDAIPTIDWLLQGAMRQWRTNYITRNIGSWFNNHLGNLGMSFLLGSNPLSVQYQRARRQFADLFELHVQGKLKPNHPDYALFTTVLSEMPSIMAATLETPGGGKINWGKRGLGNVLDRARRDQLQIANKLDAINQVIETKQTLLQDAQTTGRERLRIERTLEYDQKVQSLLEADLFKSSIEHPTVLAARFMGRDAKNFLIKGDKSYIQAWLNDHYSIIDASYKWATVKDLVRQGHDPYIAMDMVQQGMQNYGAIPPWLRSLRTGSGVGQVLGAFIPSYAAEAGRIVRNHFRNDPARFLAIHAAVPILNMSNMIANGVLPADFFETNNAETFFEQFREFTTALHVDVPTLGVSARLNLYQATPLAPFLQASGQLAGPIEAIVPTLEDNLGGVLAGAATMAMNFGSQFALNNPALNVGERYLFQQDPRSGDTMSYKDLLSLNGIWESELSRLIIPGTFANIPTATKDLNIPAPISGATKTWDEAAAQLLGPNWKRYEPSERAVSMILKYTRPQGREKVLKEALGYEDLALRKVIADARAEHDFTQVCEILKERAVPILREMNEKELRTGNRLEEIAESEQELFAKAIDFWSGNVAQLIQRTDLDTVAQLAYDFDINGAVRDAERERLLIWRELLGPDRLAGRRNLAELFRTFERCNTFEGQALRNELKLKFRLAQQQLLTRMKKIVGRRPTPLMQTVARSSLGRLKRNVAHRLAQELGLILP